MTIYEGLGEEAIKKIVQHFYQSVEKDDLLRPMYPKNLAPAEDRLFLFLVQVFGGPTTYSEQRGHPRLRQRHFPYAVDLEARNRWLGFMLAAVDSVEMPENTRTLVMQYFDQASLHLMNR